MTALYRADVPGTRRITGLTSWSSARSHADEYAAGKYGGIAGRSVFRHHVADYATVLDLRRHPQRVLADGTGLDLDDYPHAELQDLCRDLAPVFRACGYEWVAFRERQDYDEWLYVGTAPVSVVAC